MAKRFTDTTKWAGSFFGELTIAQKLAWIYLCDNCDMAGVWRVNMRLLNFQVGTDYTLDDLQHAFGDRIFAFDDQTKILIMSFIEFQYGCTAENLNSSSRVHASVLKILNSHRLSEHSGYPTGTLSGTLKDKNKDKVKVIDQSKSKEQGQLAGGDFLHSIVPFAEQIELNPAHPDKAQLEMINAPAQEKFNFESVYGMYPRKVGKAEGKALFDRQIKTRAEYYELMDAVMYYRNDCLRLAKDEKHILQFDTFMRPPTGTKVPRWKDWVEPAKSETFSHLKEGP